MRTDDLIIVKAKITMKTTEEGGRQSGFKSGYRPNHVFEMPDYLKNLITYISDIQFNDQDLIEPGETKIVLRRRVFFKASQAGVRWVCVWVCGTHCSSPLYNNSKNSSSASGQVLNNKPLPALPNHKSFPPLPALRRSVVFLKLKSQ